MNRNYARGDFRLLAGGRAQAEARLHGSEKYPDIRGTVRFYRSRNGVFVLTEVSGLPDGQSECAGPIFGFHIHNGMECTGNPGDPFANTGGHYNPHNCLHPYHAGDMPPLFGAGGSAFSCFLTDRFTIPEIIGRTVVIHAMPDDFKTQPAGNSGMKIACGKILSRRNAR